MAGHKATLIRKPEDETEFEKNVGILFRGLINDQNIQRLGRRGQKQYGIDLIGHRNGNPKEPVGIQCKLKGDRKKLTESEVKAEVGKALNYKPALTEYFITTTAPNDGKLTTLAGTLSQRQAKKGRKISIHVWGWNTLSDRINEDETAKNAFDPGYSPSIAKQNEQLAAIASAQSNAATKAQVEAINAKLEQTATVVVRLPGNYADREISDLLSSILRRRGFAEAENYREFNLRENLAQLASRVFDGDLAFGSSSLRAEVLHRAARVHVDQPTMAQATAFFEQARKIDQSIDASFFNALLDDANGKTDEALRALRQIDNADARTATYVVISRRQTVRSALDWFKSTNYVLADFNAQGIVNILLNLVGEGQFDDALNAAVAIPDSVLDQAPAARLMRAQLKIASALPDGQKQLIFHGLPINPRTLRFASDSSSHARIREASQEIGDLEGVVEQLKLTRTFEYLEELQLWLQLEDARSKDAATKKVSTELADPAKTLRRVRLALFYGIPFNRDALWRHLRSQKDVGGWTDDERFAAFLLAFCTDNPNNLANFFDEYRDDLFAQKMLPVESLAAIEIEALARAGRMEDALRRLEEHRAGHLSAEQASAVRAIVDAIAKGSETEQIRLRYEGSKGLQDLLPLVAALNARSDHRLLGEYAPLLARATRRIEDLSLAASSLFSERRYEELLGLADELSDISSADDYLASLKAWSLFRLGRVMEARPIARALFERRNVSSDRELAIGTAIESGDWGFLQSILIREVARLDAIEPQDLVRLARLALEAGSPYVNQFRDAALQRAPNDPQVHLAAYMLAVARGDEYHETQAHEWLEKAAGLSGPEGPVQKVHLKQMVDQAKGWNKHVSEIDQMLRQARIPLSMAAQALRRQPMEFIVGQAMRNESQADARWQSPILAFSGARPLIALGDVQRLALDVTTIFTLDKLGLLQKTINKFKEPLIAPTTLSTLFVERQFLRVHQPSERVKAQRIQNLISSGLLRVLPERNTLTTPAMRDVDDDLATLLSRARQEGAIVVRSAPVFKKGSFLEETAEMASYSDVLADTHAVLSFLSGKIDASVESSSQSYLQRVDKGWATNPLITGASTLFLDDLTVIYLDHVRLLEPLARSVSAVYVTQDAQERSESMLRFAAQADDLLSTVERIRATLNAALEKGEIRFTRRRMRGAEEDNDLEDEANSLPQMPALDIMANIEDIDAVACDDRFLNMQPTWSGPGRSVPTACTLDLLASLHLRGAITADERQSSIHKLRVSAYVAIPIEVQELLAQLDRAKIADCGIVETPELRAIRENVSLARRAGVFVDAEGQWLGGVRLTFLQALRELWQRPDDVKEIIPRADWLLAFAPDPLVWCTNPSDERAWSIAVRQAVFQYTLLLSHFSPKASRRDQYAVWLEKSVIEPLRVNQVWLWEMTLESLKLYVKRMLEVSK